VKVGRVEGEKTVITEGLSAGDVVVTEGIDRLQDGSKVMTRTPVPTAAPNAGRRGGKAGGGRRGGGGEASAESGKGRRGSSAP
jgi:multidrug efflux system membrane fusion protein